MLEEFLNYLYEGDYGSKLPLFVLLIILIFYVLFIIRSRDNNQRLATKRSWSLAILTANAETTIHNNKIQF